MLCRHYIKIPSLSRRLISQLNIKQSLNSRTYNNQKFSEHSFLFKHQRTSTSHYSTEVPPFTKPTNDDTKESNRTAYDPTNQEELLEKFIAGLSSNIYVKHRVYKNDILRVLNKIKELNFSTKKQGLLLLQCCTDLLPDEVMSNRMNLAEQVWRTLMPHTKFTTEHYNELLQVYLANKRTLNVNTFIQQMAPMKPNITTYELILQVLAEAGDVNQAIEVVANMKSQNIPASENIFNSLILCQGKAGNLKNINEILIMMKSLKLGDSIDTHRAIAKANIWNKKPDVAIQEMAKVKRKGLNFTENHIMDIVKTLAAVRLYTVVPEVLKYLPESTLKSPSISPYMQSVTTQLIFQNHPMVALDIYKCLPVPSFGPSDDQGLHGRSLVRDCVKASLSSSVIGFIAQDLMSSGRNPIALQNACEAALALGKVPLALDLFTRMKQMGMPLRPHYFWPILIHNSKSYGERGVLNTLSTMTTMDVKPDYDTILTYTLPYVSFTSPQNLMKKFLETGMTVSMVLTPMMETLISSGQVRAAGELCDLFVGKIEADKLMKPLEKGYFTSLDVQSTIKILEQIYEKSSVKGKDWVGRFLCKLMRSKKCKEDVTDVKVLVEALKNTKLRISTAAADKCTLNMSSRTKSPKVTGLTNDLISLTDERLFDEEEIVTRNVPHPKKMKEEELYSHMIELEAKGMNTRGVLRKLLQQYCRQGNLTAAREILDKCNKEGVFLSAGMKASVFDLYVKLGELELAEESLQDLNRTAPSFVLDEFKILDFATLMVYRQKLDRAFELIIEQSKNRNIIGGRNIELNCWRLLDALAAHGTPEQVHEMFHILSSYGYCKPTNVILGPLVRVYFKTDDLDAAVDEFVELSKAYNNTPLKHELLCKIFTNMSDGQSEENFLFNEKANSKLSKLAQLVLNVDRDVHGAGDVQITLIAALADVGYKKTLRKVLTDPSVKCHPDAILRRCERFATEKNISALENIAECAKDLRQFDLDAIYELILDVLQQEDNVQGALTLWYKMQELDMQPSQKFVRNIYSMLKSNNKPIPRDILLCIDKQTNVNVNS